MLKLLIFLVGVEILLQTLTEAGNPLHPTLDDYCALNASNTPCKFKCVRDDARCGKYPYKYKHFTAEDREFALHRHNTLRNAFAGGAYKGFPQAADMMVLSWDKECEFVTACYILQCTWAHDELRRAVQTQRAQGQNLFRWKAKTNMLRISRSFYNTSINSWFDEYKLVKPEHVEMMTTAYKRVPDPMIGHFTQMVWSATSYVGCAMYKFFGEDRHQQFYFCNYNPTGNNRGKPVYTTGKPATKCPEGTKPNSIYPNLCGNIRKYENDKFVPPIDFDPAGTKKEVKRQKEEKKRQMEAANVGGRKWQSGEGLLACLLAILLCYLQ